MVGNRALIVRKWAINFTFAMEDMARAPVWINMLDLDLHAWSSKALSKIVSLVEVPLYADQCNSLKQRDFLYSGSCMLRLIWGMSCHMWSQSSYWIGIGLCNLSCMNGYPTTAKSVMVWGIWIRIVSTLTKMWIVRKIVEFTATRGAWQGLAGQGA